MDSAYFSSRKEPVAIYLTPEEYAELTRELNHVRRNTLPTVTLLFLVLKNVSNLVVHNVAPTTKEGE